ncbi:hypothetical protein RTBOTA2_006157 [Rhodotorula toruloides]|nr:hypothetical protein RTBOTA2_006157 [Rhodotorula toruloides]
MRGAGPSRRTEERMSSGSREWVRAMEALWLAGQGSKTNLDRVVLDAFSRSTRCLERCPRRHRTPLETPPSSPRSRAPLGEGGGLRRAA